MTSMRKLAILSNINHHGKLNGTEMYPTPGSPSVPVQGANVMLGGAMISGIILVVFILCYCCHRSNRKSQFHLPTYSRDPALSMEIYTVEAAPNWFISEEHSCDVHPPPSPGPPPAYEAVVPLTLNNENHEDPTKEDETGLPSYETAIKQTRGLVVNK